MKLSFGRLAKCFQVSTVVVDTKAVIVNVSILQAYLLYSLSHVEIWQVLQHQSCNDTCQIQT